MTGSRLRIREHLTLKTDVCPSKRVFHVVDFERLQDDQNKFDCHKKPQTHGWLGSPHLNTLSIAIHLSSLEHFRVQFLAQGHTDLQAEGARDQTADLLVSGRPALPPEPLGASFMCIIQHIDLLNYTDHLQYLPTTN